VALVVQVAPVVLPIVPAAPVHLVAFRIVQLDLVVLVVPVELVELVVPAVLVVLVVLVVPAVLVVPVAAVPVHALAHADQLRVLLEGLEASHRVAVNPKGPSVKSLTTWKHPRWVVCVCLEETETAFDFHVVPV
jgi:hypothetical protein